MTRPNIPWISTHDINPHLGAPTPACTQELTTQ
jgi:hypothetical protein